MKGAKRDASALDWEVDNVCTCGWCEICSCYGRSGGVGLCKGKVGSVTVGVGFLGMAWDMGIKEVNGVGVASISVLILSLEVLCESRKILSTN